MEVREIRFIGRVSKHGEGKYIIYIPSEIVEKYGNVLEKWNISNQLLIVELKVLDGMIQLWSSK